VLAKLGPDSIQPAYISILDTTNRLSIENMRQRQRSSLPAPTATRRLDAANWTGGSAAHGPSLLHGILLSCFGSVLDDLGRSSKSDDGSASAAGGRPLAWLYAGIHENSRNESVS